MRYANHEVHRRAAPPSVETIRNKDKEAEINFLRVSPPPPPPLSVGHICLSSLPSSFPSPARRLAISLLLLLLLLLE